MKQIFKFEIMKLEENAVQSVSVRIELKKIHDSKRNWNTFLDLHLGSKVL